MKAAPVLAAGGVVACSHHPLR